MVKEGVSIQESFGENRTNQIYGVPMNILRQLLTYMLKKTVFGVQTMIQTLNTFTKNYSTIALR